MSESKRTFVISLRDAYSAPAGKRATVSVRKLRASVLKTTKAARIVIHDDVNAAIWSRSAKRPPKKLRISVSVEDDVAHVTLATEKEEGK